MTYDSAVLADTPQFYLKMQDAQAATITDSSGFGRNADCVGTLGTHLKFQQTGLIPTDSASRSILLTDDTGLAFNNTSTTGAKGYIKRDGSTWNNAQGAAGHAAEIWYKSPSGMTAAWADIGPLFSKRKQYPQQWQISIRGASNWSIHPGLANNVMAWTSAFPIDPQTNDSLYTGDYVSAISDEVTYVDPYDTNPHMYTLVRDSDALYGYFDGVRSPFYWASGVAALISNTTDPIIVGSYTQTAANGVFGYYSNASWYQVALSQERVAIHYQEAIGTVMFVNAQWSFAGASGMTLAAAVNCADDFHNLRTAPLICAASASAASAMSQNQRLGVVFADAVSIASSIPTSPVLQWVLANTVNVNAALGFNSIQQFELTDIVLAGIAIQAGDAVYDGWIINPMLGASVMVEGFGFNSFAMFKGQYYAARDSGIYLLGGDTDDGAPILSYVSLPKTTFGTAKVKRVPFAYIGAASDGTMVLRVVAGGVVHDYAVRNPTTDMAEQRVDLGRGLKSNYWQFELINPDGADFSLDTIKFMPVILERRI